MLQMSAALPSYAVAEVNSSGAMYSGVPTARRQSTGSLGRAKLQLAWPVDSSRAQPRGWTIEGKQMGTSSQISVEQVVPARLLDGCKG